MNKKNQTITKTVKKATITHFKAEETIWRAMDTLRGRSATNENYETILDLLLWADIVPTTQDGLTGYFDAMQSISEDNSWGENRSRNRQSLWTTTRGQNKNK